MASKSEKNCTIGDRAWGRSLSANALVSCSLCGAMASDPANVCDPVQYPEEGIVGDRQPMKLPSGKVAIVYATPGDKE